MNIIPANNSRIDNHQEINSSNIAVSGGGRIIKTLTSEECIKITAYSLITSSSIAVAGMFFKDYPVFSIIYCAITTCTIDLADRVITNIYYKSNTSTNQETINRVNNLNIRSLREHNQNFSSLRQRIIGNNGTFAKINQPKIRQLNTIYNELTELPSNYHYNDSDVCAVKMVNLQQGDTVCCDTYLYSFEALKEYYEKHNGNTIPHNRQPLDWNKVYKLPAYGITPTS